MHEKTKAFLSTSKLYLAQISVWSEQEMEFSVILYADLEIQLGKQEHLPAPTVTQCLESKVRSSKLYPVFSSVKHYSDMRI